MPLTTYNCTALTGGAARALDSHSVGDLGDGDRAVCAVGGTMLYFMFNSTATDAEDVTNHPYKVRPDDYVDQGVWIEQQAVENAVTAGAAIADNRLVRGDGGAKKIQECSTITVSDDGEMVNTGQPKFKAYVNTTQNNVTGDDILYSTTGSFWTENIDDGNNFSNGIFTAPVDGFYQFNVTMYIQGIVSSSNHKRFDLLLNTSNGTFSLNRLVITNALGGLAGGTGSISIYLDANDTAYVQINVANDTKVIGLSDNQSGFSGALIC